MVVVVVGWFYVMGGRTRAHSFCLATVVDRLLIPAFLDPLLALGAYAIWRREGASHG